MAPDAVKVSAHENFLLQVIFDTGEEKIFDCKPLLSRKCYAGLKNKALFRTATVLHGVVSWADGSDIDPDWLYEDSLPVC